MPAQQIRFQLTVGDYLSATLIHTHWIRTFLIMAVGVPALIFFTGDLPIAVLCSALMSLYVLGARFVYAPLRAHRVFKNHKAISLPRIVAWNEEELSTESSEFAVRTPWSGFVRWLENSRLFALYTSNLKVHVLPKTAFRGAADIADFRRLIQHKIAPRPGVERKASPADVFA